MKSRLSKFKRIGIQFRYIFILVSESQKDSFLEKLDHAHVDYDIREKQDSKNSASDERPVF